jgi:signal transduction histidine kinase/CheY-like chemotaxis protein/HPt (histidine-containing phosphotransfer) domain-containing protein
MQLTALEAVRESEERMQLILDASPFCVNFWNKDFVSTMTNMESVRLFGASGKQEYLDGLRELSPEFQPDGERSSEKSRRFLQQAFEEGYHRFEWMHQTFKGEPVPCEITLVRIKYHDDYIVAGYTRDLRELKTALSNLEDALNDAKTANRSKSLFLANMSHEMRTPLTAVLGLSELTLETTRLDVKAHSNLVKIYRAGDTLLNLINDILDISKIEADKLELHPREYDLPSLLNDTITQSILFLGEKDIEFVLDMEEDLPNYLYGDELRIKQILNNLLSNAFKFTREGSVRLSIRCDRDGDTVWLTAQVHDTGIGIKAEDMDKLFTLYGRLEEDNGHSGVGHTTTGTGLGLSISKRVAEMMDGSITLESEYGKGSVFTVRLRQKYVSDAVIDTEVAESLKKYDYSVKKRETAKVKRINLSYARVLIVDDNPTNLDVAKGLMGLYGMAIDCVTGGQQAVDIIRNEKVRYDAIFMDHMMPDMNGIEAAKIIRDEIKTDYAKNIPIIALTANAIVGNEEMFMSKGFQAFLSKPIDLANLDAVLRQWVRDKKAETILPVKTVDNEVMSGGERRIPDIPGLDVDRGIGRFDFNEDIYIRCLQSFVRNTSPILEKINRADAVDLDSYAITVHGIRGSSAGIFAEEAEHAAEALENAAKAGDHEFILTNNPGFISLISKLISDIGDALAKSGIKEKPIKDKPDAASLTKLLSACNSFDIDEIDAVMTEIESYEYASDDGLAGWLRETVDQGDYDGIIKKLSAIFNGMEV